MSLDNINSIFTKDELSIFTNKKSDVKEIKKSIHLEQKTTGVIVFAVAIHKDIDKNHVLEIPADKGKPLSYEAYDIVRDCYHVLGHAYYVIGRIPVNYTVYFDDISWSADIPLPLPVINKYMDEYQKKLHDAWLKKYEKDNYEIRYFQMLSVN